MNTEIKQRLLTEGEDLVTINSTTGETIHRGTFLLDKEVDKELVKLIKENEQIVARINELNTIIKEELEKLDPEAKILADDLTLTYRKESVSQRFDTDWAKQQDWYSDHLKESHTKSSLSIKLIDKDA